VWGAINAAAGGVDVPSLRHAVIACSESLSAAGAGLALTRPRGGLEPLLATGADIRELEELQFTLGQGPGVDAKTSGVPESATDLVAADAGRRWSAFAPAAVERGMRGVFAFPVGAGAAGLGVLTVYRQQPGPLHTGQWLDALVFADAVFVLALDHRLGVSVDLHEVIDAAFTARRAEVHQAAGRLAAQQSISVADALARLRAHAYSTGTTLHRVAVAVMAGQLWLESDDGYVALSDLDGTDVEQDGNEQEEEE